MVEDPQYGAACDWPVHLAELAVGPVHFEIQAYAVARPATVAGSGYILEELDASLSTATPWLHCHHVRPDSIQCEVRLEDNGVANLSWKPKLERTSHIELL